MMLSRVGCLATLLLISQSFAEESRPDSRKLQATIETTLASVSGKPEVSIWFGSIKGQLWHAQYEMRDMPSASAIKTFYLVELFVEHRDSLDKPLPGAEAVLMDDLHPAISHFSTDQKQDIRKTLRGKSVRELGKIMMGSAPASNAAYNAAANVITACLGGAEALTQRIQKRDPAFDHVFVRRYMLRDRNENGDNETTAHSLAMLYQMLAQRALPGVDRNTVEAIRSAMVRKGNPQAGFVYMKDGALNSDPLSRVQAGWKEFSDGSDPLIFVVMIRQMKPQQGVTREAAGDALDRACSEIQKKLISSVE